MAQPHFRCTGGWVVAWPQFNPAGDRGLTWLQPSPMWGEGGHGLALIQLHKKKEAWGTQSGCVEGRKHGNLATGVGGNINSLCSPAARFSDPWEALQTRCHI